MSSRKPRYFACISLAFVPLVILSGCLSKHSMPPYPSDWPAAAQGRCDCLAISGTYADSGIEADANGYSNAASLWHLLEAEDPNKVQNVTLRLGPIGKFEEGELAITAMRDGAVVRSQVRAYKCVNGEAVFERADAGLDILLLGFEQDKKALATASDGSLVVKSFYKGGGLLLFIPVWDEEARLFRFEQIPDAAEK